MLSFKKLFLLLATWAIGLAAGAQSFGVSTNALGWGALTPNVGLDVGLAKHLSFEVDAGINPFSFSENRSTKFWAVQPEFKIWFREKFDGFSIGLHGTYGEYDFGLWKYLYNGTMYGGGLSLNYAWILSEKWNMELSLGGGYTHLDQSNQRLRTDPLSCYGPESIDIWGLSKAGLTFSYYIGKVKPQRSAAFERKTARAVTRKMKRPEYQLIRAAVREELKKAGLGE